MKTSFAHFPHTEQRPGWGLLHPWDATGPLERTATEPLALSSTEDSGLDFSDRAFQ